MHGLRAVGLGRGSKTTHKVSHKTRWLWGGGTCQRRPAVTSMVVLHHLLKLSPHVTDINETEAAEEGRYGSK